MPLPARPHKHARQQREVANAEEEGVEFVWLSAPKGFLGDLATTDTAAPEAQAGNVSGVRVARMRLGPPDVTGRQAPRKKCPARTYTEDADMVIKALGFEPEPLPTLWDVPGLEVTRWGTVKADFTTQRRRRCPASLLQATSCAAQVAGGLGDPRRARGRRQHFALHR